MKVSDIQGFKVISSPKVGVADSNNPFNMKMGPATADYIKNGQASVGRAAPDGGNFLNFKDRNQAVEAASSLLFKSGVYKGLTVDAALKKWSNNGYGGDIVPSLSTSTIDSLTPEQQTQVLNAMELKGENDAVPDSAKTLSKIGTYTIVQPGQQKPAQKQPFTPAGFAPAPANMADATKQVGQNAKKVFDVATAGEQGLGKEIAAALPSSWNGMDEINKANQENTASDINFIHVLAQKVKNGEKLTAQQQAALATVSKRSGQVAKPEDALPGLKDSSLDVALNAGQVALDAATFGTAGVIKKGAEIAADKVGIGAAAAARKEMKTLTDLVSPIASKKVSISAIRSGLGKAATFLKPAELSADKATIQAARSVQGIVGKGVSYIENSNRVIEAIGKEAEALKAKLATSKVTFTPAELNKALKDAYQNLPGLLRHNNELSKTFQEVMQHVIDKANTMPGKIGSVLDLRQEFDNEVARQFGDLYSNTKDLTPVKQSVKGIRDALNEFIEKRVPELEYKASLFKQSSMYDALEALSEKASKEVGKLNPTAQKVWDGTKWIMKAGAAFGLGLLGEKAVTGGFSGLPGAEH